MKRRFGQGNGLLPDSLSYLMALRWDWKEVPTSRNNVVLNIWNFKNKPFNPIRPYKLTRFRLKYNRQAIDLHPLKGEHMTSVPVPNSNPIVEKPPGQPATIVTEPPPSGPPVAPVAPVSPAPTVIINNPPKE